MRKTALALLPSCVAWGRPPALGIFFLTCETGGLAASDGQLVASQCGNRQPDTQPEAGRSGNGSVHLEQKC